MTRLPAPRRVSAAQLAATVRDSITRLNRRLRQTRPVGDLTVTQVSALQSLDGAGALTPRELADIERVQPPTMTKIIGKLEDKGLLVRTPHPTDGRQVVLAPSTEGRELIASYRKARDEWLARQLAALTPEERETIHRAAELLARIAREDRQPPR